MMIATPPESTCHYYSARNAREFMAMTLPICRTGILLVCLALQLALSASESQSYVGAVVEYSPVKRSEDGQKLGDLNAQNYIKFIEKASEYHVDIIVFPESSLSLSASKNATEQRSEAASYIPDPSESLIPCSDQPEKYANSLRLMSCAAREHRMYVVINHREKVDCQPKSQGCPSDGLLIYNSHVTLDRDGRVISRYRKYNLFDEPDTNRTAEPQPTTFSTDFGVTFGQFICFDVLFEKPAVTLPRDHGVTDIVYSAHWYSNLPFGYGIEVQAAWAHANDVNFLAAGRSTPQTGSGGSGIFIGRQGYVEAIADDKASNVLVVAEIPKKIEGQRRLPIDLTKRRVYRFSKSEISTTDESKEPSQPAYQTSDLADWTTKAVDSRSGSYVETLCHSNSCCVFKLKLEFNESAIVPGSDYYRYRMFAFNATMSFAGQGSGHSKSCVIVSCLSDKLDSCGKLFDLGTKVVAPITLRQVDISVARIDNERSLYLPITLAGDKKPLNATGFSFGKINATAYEMRLAEPRNDLLAFGTMCHYYGQNGSASMPIFSLLAFLLIGLVAPLLS